MIAQRRPGEGLSVETAPGRTQPAAAAVSAAPSWAAAVAEAIGIPAETGHLAVAAAAVAPVDKSTGATILAVVILAVVVAWWAVFGGKHGGGKGRRGGRRR